MIDTSVKEYQKKLNLSKNYVSFLLAIFSALFTLSISSKLRIINPSETGWLSIEDGRAEIAWEFFRRSKFPNWLQGDLYLYGMEASNPIYFSTIPPLYAYLLKPFSTFLPDRFQFFGVMILLNFILIYFVSYKIFSIFKLSFTASNIGAFLILMSPLSLHRLIDQSHYVLTANWLILLAMYLVLLRNRNPHIWAVLLTISVLIIAYYTLMLLVIYLIWMISEMLCDKKNFKNFFLMISTSSIYIAMSLYLTGFFKSLDSSPGTGYGYYKSNLLSLVDPNGWSNLIPSFTKSAGDYEGFSFIGTAFLLTLFINIILILFKKLNKINEITFIKSRFKSLWISGLILFLFSFSNSIEILGFELFSFNPPAYMENILNIFRSTGRFTWILAYVVMFFSFIVFSKFLADFRSIFLISILILIVFVQFFDIQTKLQSQLDGKFALSRDYRLKDPFWAEIKQCYEAYNSIPAHKFSSHAYDLAEVASRNGIGVHPAFTARDSEEKVEKMILEAREMIKFGSFNAKRLYVFQPDSQFTTKEITENDFKLALHTMNEKSRAGNIDGLLVIAPNFEDCGIFTESVEPILSIQKQKSFKVDMGETIFGSAKPGDRLLLDGWSQSENWGTWSVDSRASIFMQLAKVRDTNEIVLVGNLHQKKSGALIDFDLKVNGSYVDFEISKQGQNIAIVIPVKNQITTNDLFIDFYFNNLVSPLEEGVSQDPRPLGFAIKRLIVK